MSRKKPGLRIKGQIPPDYQGPIYYRTAEDMFAPAERMTFRWVDDQARLARVFNYNERETGWRRLVDESGNILPEWRIPLKAKIISDKPVLREYALMDPYTRVTERIHDAIVALEPSSHIFIPIDASRSDGSTERLFAMFMGTAKLGQVLHPEANNLEPMVYDSGRTGFRDPDWLRSRDGESHHFGYLDHSIIGDRHLFEGSNGIHYFSSELLGSIQNYGDILPRLDYFVPIGVV